ncbi:hypothetical protein KGA66_26825 [Actinocrinis puniceicyclus]|uniref:ApeA N-terminal domain-containing protein n=1 Tax=Actinocrinis puniceicyclus TaxID=977794 RepID=A0A8J7WTX9_9ACTN|nr:HEPN domain-containing protein [Actinocrinis puniceicyclus]MBS2966680.1 hypothetical protein [Actinocrinis puniceicyclus]
MRLLNNPQGIKTEFLAKATNAGEAVVTLMGCKVDDQDIALEDGATLYLKQRLGVSGDGVSSRAIVQDFAFELEVANLTPVEELLEVASDFQDLISIATSRNAAFSGVAFRHPEVKGRNDVYRDIDYSAEWVAQPDDLGAPRPLVFTLDAMGGVPALARWAAESRKYRSELGRVMSTRYVKSMYVSDKLLNRVAALESFDRALTGRTNDTLRNRLKRSAERAGAEFKAMIGDIDKWSMIVKSDRNDVAHHLGQGREGAVQYFLAESAYWLFVMNMLRVCDAPQTVFDSIAKYREFSMLCDRVPALVQATMP